MNIFNTHSLYCVLKMDKNFFMWKFNTDKYNIKTKSKQSETENINA